MLDTENVVLNRLAVEEGLAVLQTGGDFADGLIAYEGKWLGGEMFASFDKKAVKLIAAQGHEAQLLVDFRSSGSPQRKMTECSGKGERFCERAA